MSLGDIVVSKYVPVQPAHCAGHQPAGTIRLVIIVSLPWV